VLFQVNSKRKFALIYRHTIRAAEYLPHGTVPPSPTPLREKMSISVDTYAVAFGAWVGEGLYSLPCKAQLVPSHREVGTSFGQFFTLLL
jgi:hypothetical protein